MNKAQSPNDSALLPSTSRGRRTRERLIAGAREIFERDGFIAARIVDIANNAGMAVGSFYTYFSSKEAIFREVALAVREEQLGDHEHAGEGRPASLYLRLEQANRRYLERYQTNAAIIAVIEQVATFNDELRLIRMEMRSEFVRRAESTIQRLRDEGAIAADIEPRHLANALGAMVDRFAYVWFVLGEDFDFETSVRTLTNVWAAAIGVEEE